jgi:hypothetical protein
VVLVGSTAGIDMRRESRCDRDSLCDRFKLLRLESTSVDDTRRESVPTRVDERSVLLDLPDDWYDRCGFLFSAWYGGDMPSG